MFEPANCTAVIPCLNESASIATLVSAVRRHLTNVVVVDDGSTDHTGAIARGAGAGVVTHERNLGKGAALKTGLAWALKQGCQWAVTLDGDGQHAPEDLPALFRCVQNTNASLIIGNRMSEAHKMPWLRGHVNRWMSRQLSQSRMGPGSCQTHNRGSASIHLAYMGRLGRLTTERFEAESEMLMAFLAAGQRVEFVPVQVIQGRRQQPHPADHRLCALAQMVAEL